MSKEALLSLLGRVRQVHFIGIGGVSMSALAEILKNRGYFVTGSDISESSAVLKLRAKGIPVAIGHDPKNIGGAELVIHTAAIHEDNCEMVAAKVQEIPNFERADLLGAIMTNYDYPIAIAGAHGKTTTTSFVSKVLIEAGKDPTCLVGGQLSAIGGNFRVGKSPYMVCEACEYCDSFLTLSPKISVVLNVEADHLDYFSGLDAIKKSFHTFINLAGSDGLAIVCADSKNALDVAVGAVPKVITFGLDNQNADYTARQVGAADSGYPCYDFYRGEEKLAHIELSVPGKHNILNSLCAAVIADVLGIDPVHIQSGVSTFTGTKRRFEKLGTLNGADIVDDYAHHPSEIKATLAAARALPYKRIICLFQPHTYTRTIALFDDFVEALKGADIVGLAEIYAAREKNLTGISSKDLAEKISGAVYLPALEDVAAYIKEVASPGDLIFTMGAGDIYKAGLLALGQ